MGDKDRIAPGSGQCLGLKRAQKLGISAGMAAKIIVGSVRHLFDVSEALSAGAHIVTVPPPIFRAMLRHPRTEETIREFNAAWAAAKPSPGGATETRPGGGEGRK